MPKRKPINRIVIVLHSGIIEEIAADNPKDLEITIIDKDFHIMDRVTEASDGEKAIVEEYPVDRLNADHDKWLLSDPKIGAR